MFTLPFITTAKLQLGSSNGNGWRITGRVRKVENHCSVNKHTKEPGTSVCKSVLVPLLYIQFGSLPQPLRVYWTLTQTSHFHCRNLAWEDPAKSLAYRLPHAPLLSRMYFKSMPEYSEWLMDDHLFPQAGFSNYFERAILGASSTCPKAATLGALGQFVIQASFLRCSIPSRDHLRISHALLGFLADQAIRRCILSTPLQRVG